jgi:hypothetical protein
MQENQAQLTERLSFNEAVAFVQQTGKAAFAAMPVFGDDEDDENATAEGARVFLLLPDEDDGWSLRFIAGPFFTSAYAANDVIPAEEIPDRVRELLFMPTRCEDDWLTDQLQILLGKADPGRRHRRADAGLRKNADQRRRAGSGIPGELHQRPEKAALKAERQRLAHRGISPRATQA